MMWDNSAMTSQGARTIFDPAGIEFRPVSDGLMKARLIITAAVLAVPLIVAIIIALTLTAWLWIAVGVIAVLAAWLSWLIPRQVRALGYAETESDLVIRRGIMFRSLSIVPYGRMQYVDVSEGPIARWCGIASIQLHTASAATDASIDGLPPAEAARLRDRLTAKGEANLAGL